MSKSIVLVTPRLVREIHHAALKLLEASFEVRCWDQPGPMPRSEIIRSIGDADAILSGAWDRIDREVIDRGRRLKLIANMAVGFNNVDIAAAVERGIVVTYTPHVLTDAVADHTIGLLIGLCRRIAEADRLIRGGGWTDIHTAQSLLGREVSGATVGIVGFGRIGRAVAKRAASFSMRVVYSDPVHSPEMREAEEKLGALRLEFPALLADSDIVSLHPSLNSSSRNLMQHAALGTMKKSAVLLNTSRGPIVNTEALVQALQRNLIAGAALDVVDPEPLPSGHPLSTMANVVLTPHMASQTPRTRAAMSDLAARNVVDVLLGRPPLTPVPASEVT